MSSRTRFADRVDAGRALGRVLERHREAAPVVLGLPRGGVPVAYEVARALGAPLDVCVVRKIGAPGRPELGVGAVGEDGALVVDRELMARVGLHEAELRHAALLKRAEVGERVRRYRHGGPPIDIRGRTVIVVDDGIATGGTARAAIHTLRARGAARLVLAVPVGAAETVDALSHEADEVVCLHRESPLWAVGLWYEDFDATTDEEVERLLEERTRELQPTERGAPRRSERVRIASERDVRIPVGERGLVGTLSVPADPRGLVLFAHGSGSSRHSPRNQYVANVLRESGLATLLFDLLDPEEEEADKRTGHLRFDIGLLATRLVGATDWVAVEPETRLLDVGYFGASTGAAAALVAAAERPRAVRAVVSRGGRPDLAGPWLAKVVAPTLLLVGGRDVEVLSLNRGALRLLTCDKRLEVIPGATHLFEEPGALEGVALLASRWLGEHLGAEAAPAAMGPA